jgi:hypothetical protein
MKADDPGHIELRELVSPESSLYWNEVSHFGEYIHDNPDGIVASRLLGYANNKVHVYVIPFPLGDL